MSKYYSKTEKLQMLEKVKDLSCNTAAKILNINKSTITRWRKELRSLGENSLEPGYGMQAKGIKKKVDQNL